MRIRAIFLRIHQVFSGQFGIDPIRMVRGVQGLPQYIRGLYCFRSRYTGSIELLPCLHDWLEEGGYTRSEYFWQDLLVARWIFEENPVKHVDVGSRIDGFVAHVASFREIEVFDVRPISTKVSGIVFKQADFMQPLELGECYCDSLSCLHAIEHFGLGRYGDPIDPMGYQCGIANMARLLKLGGRFYLSTPIGQERVEFNAHRVFDPRTINRCAEDNGLRLQELTLVGADGKVSLLALNDESLRQLSQARYNLGIFVFIKIYHKSPQLS